jgi:hypothetical protein
VEAGDKTQHLVLTTEIGKKNTYKVKIDLFSANLHETDEIAENLENL